VNGAERWGRVSEILSQALDLEGEERERFLLESARREPDLGRELRELSEQLDQGDDFLETPPVLDLEIDEQEDFGPYRVVGQLGEGGMGVVLLAERSDGQFDRRVAIKRIGRLAPGPEARRRFQEEGRILAGLDHPNIARLLDAGLDDSGVPFLILEHVEGRTLDRWCREQRPGLRERLQLFLKVCAAVLHAHQQLVVHRDIKPANILVKLPDPTLRGSQMTVKLADFNVGKVADPDVDLSMTRFQAVPGTLFFQSPEQEINTFDVLCNATQGSPEIEFFEDFYIDIYENDVFSLFNRNEQYLILSADRVRKKIMLNRPFAEPSETNVRGRVVKSVGRPADIYSLGALFYYLVSGAYANPKNLSDAFRKFIECDKKDETNTVAGYIEHEYRTIANLRAPRTDGQGVELAPEDRFYSYKHYLDGNGELIDPVIMMIIGKSMVRNKPDSYCTSWDLRTTGISQMVNDLISLYVHYGVDPSARMAYDNQGYQAPRKPNAMRRTWDKIFKR
jgi:serine/threonine protein kinase